MAQTVAKHCPPCACGRPRGLLVTRSDLKAARGDRKDYAGHRGTSLLLPQAVPVAAPTSRLTAPNVSSGSTRGGCIGLSTDVLVSQWVELVNQIK
jgi:hypothetical protein